MFHARPHPCTPLAIEDGCNSAILGLAVLASALFHSPPLAPAESVVSQRAHDALEEKGKGRMVLDRQSAMRKRYGGSLTSQGQGYLFDVYIGAGTSTAPIRGDLGR